MRHAFRHRVYQWLVDLDDVPRQPWYLRAFARFSSADHLGDPGLPIKRNVENYLARSGIRLGAGGRVLMLANARVLGHVFDPLSVFWCYAADGVLICVVAEVHNTYGERHAYLLRPDGAGAAVTDKAFYVSPFFDVSGSYALRFTLRPDLVVGDRHAAPPGRRGVHRDLPGTPGTRDAPGAGPPADPPAPHDPAGLGPDPGARPLALAASPAHPLPTTSHPARRGLTMTMTVSASLSAPRRPPTPTGAAQRRPSRG